VVGGPIAHLAGFSYSDALMALHNKGEKWTYENLDKFLTSPKAFAPGTAMGFLGIKKPDERANVIAYLRTLSDNPVPLPEASASEAAPADTAPDSGAAAPAAASPETPAAAAPAEPATAPAAAPAGDAKPAPAQ
jgi:cytochrome c